METISIINAKDYVDQKVRIGVWLTNKRSSGKTRSKYVRHRYDP